MSDPGAGVPLFATRAAVEPLLDEVARRVEAVLRSGRYILGPEVEAFEAELASFAGTSAAVGVASGTDALVIGLRALGVGPGDEVVVPALTYYATAEAVVLAGATPVFCDVDPRTLTMTAATAEPLLNERTTALIPVHLYGNPAPMTELAELASARGLRLLADGAQALGAEQGGSRAGVVGDLAALSFFPSKNLGGFGDGGALVGDDEEALATARRLRAHGSSDRETHVEVGYNSRLDEVQAAALRVLLPHLEGWTAARREVADGYRASGLGEHVELPVETAESRSCHHLYVVRSDRRDELSEAFAAAGVESRAYYRVPLHRQPAMAPYAAGEPLPATDRAAEASLALPMGPALSGEDVERVAAAAATALGG